MAKNDKNTEATEKTEAKTEVAAVEADERFKKITHPETGEVVNRKDYIMECWQKKKMSRGQIAKHLSEITGKKVIYQVVFAVIKKGTPGGPDPVPAAPVASETASN